MIEHDTWCPDVTTPVASTAPALQEVAVGANSRLTRWRQCVNITPGRTGRIELAMAVVTAVAVLLTAAPSPPA
jgi:hypothetical protein